MLKQTTLLAGVLFLALQACASADDLPREVQNWLKAHVGKWEITGGVEPDQVGKHTSTLVAGGKVLVTRGTTGDGTAYLSVDAWEADKERLVTTIYLADGAYLRREQQVEKDKIQGTVEAIDAEGRPFSGHLSVELTSDGAIDSSYEGTLAGEDVVLTWKAVRVSPPSAEAASAQPADLPQKAREALEFLVGDWEIATYENGDQLGEGAARWKWAPDKYCLTVLWEGEENGSVVRGAGISGWDAHAKAVVEHWFSKGGLAISVCYPLEKMKPDAWEGDSSVTTSDGTNVAGQVRLTKTKEGYEYVSRGTVDGKEMEYKVVARRVKK